MQTTEVIVRHETAELARVSLPAGDYIIGRSREADIHAETPLISRQHARLTLLDDAVLIEDLASSNGTFVDGQQIFETTRLEPGQMLSLGDVQVELVRPPAPSSSATNIAPLQSIAHLLPDELLSQQRYAIGQQVARGGMGAILQAEQAPMKRRVAMKVMLENCDADDVIRFVEEAQITGQLEHPGIVPIYELGIDEQRQLFYTMKFVRGITLKKVLELIGKGVEATAKKFPLPALLTIFQKTCDAIAFAHSKGVIHRDLKPENIMLGDFGEVLVMDWGLAKVLGVVSQPNLARLQRTPVSSSRSMTGGSSHTLSGMILGTPQYMAPEQARGEVDLLDVRADIYALGAILFEILHLRAPFSGLDAWDIVEKVKRGEVEWSADAVTASTSSTASASSLASATGGAGAKKKTKSPPIPDSLLAICRKAIAFDREQRYARVDQLQDDISAYQHGFVTSAEKASWPRRVAMAIKRNKTVSIAATLVTFAVLFFGTHAVIQGRTAKRALADLKRNAPALLQLATTEASFRQFGSALEKIDGAISIDPTLRAAYWQRAWTLIGLERWAEAAAALRLAGQRDPTKAALAAPATALDEIAAMPDDKARFASAQMPVVMEHLDRAGVPGIRLHFAQKLVVDAEKKQKAVQERLDQWRGTDRGRIRADLFGPMKWVAVRLGAATVDTIEPLRGLPIEVLTFSSRSITSLEPLRGMPLRELECGGTPIEDLKPLQGMPLRRLYLSSTKVEDLSPLKGLPIEQLDLTNTPATDATPLAGMPLKTLSWTSGRVTDLSPLKGAPLESVLLYNTQVADLSFLAGAPVTRLEINNNRAVTSLHPLAGLPIADLNIENCAGIKDLRPLLDLRSLEKLRTNARRSEIAILRNHPSLKFISVGNSPPRAVADYWAESEAVLPTVIGVERRTLRALDLAESPEVTSIDFARGLPFELVDLRRTKVTDIGVLAGMKTLSVLRVATCPISDFSPIKGLPLTELRIGSSSFADLSLLEGMPLGLLTIDNTPITDVAPLAKMTTLRMICIPRGAKNIDRLRQLPQLTHIGYAFNIDREAPDRTAAEFWREFDAAQKAGEK